MTDENFDSNPQLGEKCMKKNEKNMLMEHEVNH
jgi:hypothetical protein